ncbi:MAG: glycosyltransferase family 4 protein [Methanocellales archaeon]|nr:glycosyltransferase family 4 protein [Methanocellales archaeon]MDD3291868.1 glycosyltransferase family 4 protein [Methanocellales archaeon]MDD5235511.1 glycosyltransferase family 4 protein [Methanocellales archaeon]MDD5485130.1 glycosyltransferase family 4 protein [Methanocellales archaeon]
MKIAMTVSGYSKEGGISRYVSELAERFVKDHEVHIFSSEWKDVGDDNLVFHKTMSIPKPPSIFILSYLFSTTLNIKVHDFDIVQSNGADRFSADIINTMSIHKAWLEVLKKEKWRTIFGRKILTPGNLIVLALEKYSYGKRKYKKLIACSSSTKRELMKYYNVPKEDIEVIPLGVNLDEFRPLQDKNLIDLKQKYGIYENDIVLIIVATEFHRKGLTELIKSLSIVKNKEKANLKLLVVGSGKNIPFDYLGLIEKLGFKNNIIFTGPINNKKGDLNKHYNLADIFVFPTKYEGFGIPVVEAMAAGLPVVTTNTAAGEDAVEPGKNGLLIDDPTNVMEIAKKMSTLIEDESIRKQMGRNARRTAEKFTWDDIAKRTLEVYEGILKR